MRKILYIFIIAIFIIACSEQKEQTYYKLTGFTQGTTYTITYEDSLSRNFQLKVDSLLTLIDESVSTYKERSLISEFNNLRDTTSWFLIDDIFYQNLILSNHIHKLSSRAFDPTVSPLYSYFNFDNNGISEIDSSKISNILNSSVGLDFIEINHDKHQIKKMKPQIELSFNAIAQGFSVDFIGINLEALGVENYMIEVGGEILTSGGNSRGKDWTIGIDAPNEKSKPGENFQKVVSLKNQALATSGNYRKFFTIGDKRYSHTLNPLTGFPINHNLLSVSVISETCAEADAYATAFMVLGVEKSMEVIENKALNIEAYFISSGKDGLVEKQTEGFQLN